MSVLQIIPMWLDPGAQISVGELRETGMVLGELTVNPERAIAMNVDKAGQ